MRRSSCAFVRLRREALELVRSDERCGSASAVDPDPGNRRHQRAATAWGAGSLSGGDVGGGQWVAHSGLDPAHQVSGTSVHKPSRISRAGNRHLRHALYMPALVAVRRDPHLKAFYESLLSRHKAKLQALIAVARKTAPCHLWILRTQTLTTGASSSLAGGGMSATIASPSERKQASAGKQTMPRENLAGSSIDDEPEAGRGQTSPAKNRHRGIRPAILENPTYHQPKKCLRSKRESSRKINHAAGCGHPRND